MSSLLIFTSYSTIFADNNGSSGGHLGTSSSEVCKLIQNGETFQVYDYGGNLVTVSKVSGDSGLSGIFNRTWSFNGYIFDDEGLENYLNNFVCIHSQTALDVEHFWQNNKEHISDIVSLLPGTVGIIGNFLGKVDNYTHDYQPDSVKQLDNSYSNISLRNLISGFIDKGKFIYDNVKKQFVFAKDSANELRNKMLAQYYNSIGAYCFYQHNEYQTISNFRTTLLTNWDKIDSSKRLMSSEQFNALFDSNDYDFCTGRDNGFFGLSKKKYTYCYLDDVTMANGVYQHLCFADSKLNLVYPFKFNEMYHAPELTPYANDGKTCSFDYLPAFSLIISSTWGNYLEPHPVTDYYSNYLNDWYKSSYSSKKLYAWKYSYSGVAFYGGYFKNSNARIIIFKTKSDFINYYNSKHSTYINANAFNEVKEDVNINLDDIKNISSKMDAVIDAINNTDKSNMSADDLDNLIDKVSGKLDNIDNSISDNSEILKQILQELKNNGYKINDNIENNNSFFDKILQEMKIQESLLQQMLGVTSDISSEVEMQTYIDKVNSITLTENVKNGFKNVGNEMKNHFPFSAPWDLQRIYSTLSADESPPVFKFDYSFMYNNWLGGSTDVEHILIIDFKDYQMLSDISKGLLSLLFLYELIQLTQKFIFKEVG